MRNFARSLLVSALLLATLFPFSFRSTFIVLHPGLGYRSGVGFWDLKLLLLGCNPSQFDISSPFGCVLFALLVLSLILIARLLLNSLLNTWFFTCSVLVAAFFLSEWGWVGMGRGRMFRKHWGWPSTGQANGQATTGQATEWMEMYRWMDGSMADWTGESVCPRENGIALSMLLL